MRHSLRVGTKYPGALVCLLAGLTLPGLVESSGAQNASGAGASALASLRGLAGEWEGSYQWSGARTDGGSLSATYSVTGNGSAVVETLVMGGVPSMTSVYHLDGDDLRMTHFCAAQNQPRLKANRIDLARGAFDFAFVDATNLLSPDAPHVYGMQMRLIDSEHITITFLFGGGGKKSEERITLKRMSPNLSTRS